MSGTRGAIVGLAGVALAACGGVAIELEPEVHHLDPEDHPGHEPNDQLKAPPLTCGEVGYALAFDGDDDYVDMGDPTALGLTQFTIETWFLREGHGETARTGGGGVRAIPLVTKGKAEAEGDERDLNYFVGIEPYERVVVADFEDADGVNHPVIGTTPIEHGAWHHVAASYDGGTWRLYLDGALEATEVVGETPASHSMQPFALGTAMDSMGGREGAFEGRLDEVRVWSRALSKAEVLSALRDRLAEDESLVAQWSLEELTGNTVSDSVSGNDGLRLGPKWGAVGAPFAVESPPGSPVRIKPEFDGDDAILRVTAIDPDDEPLRARIIGRELGTAVPPPFTFVVLPDTQGYAAGFPGHFLTQTQWIHDNEAALNVPFVAHVGDIVETASIPAEWDIADTALSMLEKPGHAQPHGIPYGVTVGNHDLDEGSSVQFNEAFGVDRFQDRDYWGGSRQAGLNDDNFALFSAAGMDFVVVFLGYRNEDIEAQVDWADGILGDHAQRRAILVSHYLMEPGEGAPFGPQGQAIYSGLSHHENLFLMLAGHRMEEGHRVDPGQGQDIHTVLANYQGRPEGGHGWLRLMQFDPADNTIRVRTYSPVLDRFEDDTDSEFSFEYEMGGTADAPVILGEVAVEEGEAQFRWNGLESGMTYEWSVEVRDCHTSTAGPRWRFVMP